MNAETAPTTGPREAAGRPPVRAATSADAGAITRMRSAYVLSAPLTDDWLRLSTDELAPRLTPQGDARAFVVDAPDGTMAACALGLISPVLPAPAYPRGRAARVQIAATRPEFRRRGYARAVVSTLLDHLADVEDVTLFELHTSPEAAPLCREARLQRQPRADADDPTPPTCRHRRGAPCAAGDDVGAAPGLRRFAAPGCRVRVPLRHR